MVKKNSLKIFCCVEFILFNLNFTFILPLNLSCFLSHLQEMFKSIAIMLCFITQQKIVLKHIFVTYAFFLIASAAGSLFCMYMYVSVCVSVCMCVCVCVFILFRRKGFFRLQWCLGYTWGYGSTNLRCEYYSQCFSQVLSSPFLNLSYFASKNKTPTSWRKDDIYWHRM